ncbi:MAG TPA: hypothetical protein VFR10_02335, partial [bacterium]|nr:hypothetical protein [bacterium]
MPTIRASAYSTALILAFLNPAPAHAQRPSETWRYYRPTNTGIQGDYCDAIWVGPDNDPWIGGYDPTFEEGGIAKFVQTDNRWINISNVDYPIIGHPNDTGTSRVSDIVGDANGVLWMATGRGALRFDPAIGPSSLVKFDPSNSELNGGWTEDVDLGPDNTVWFAARSVNWGDGGIARYNVATNTWTGWDAVGDLVSVQRKPGGGYFVWNGTMGNSAAFVQRFDSATQQWTLLPHTGAPGEVIALAGKDCVDDLDNFWALRVTTPGNYHSLDYLRSDGTWVTPPEPYDGVTFDLWAFKAFGQKQALLVDGQNRTWRFNGSTWQDLGIWRPGAFSESVDIDSFGNVWVSGVEGAAKRNAQTGQWQRYRVTNTSQYDFFNDDVAIDPAGGVCACANAGPGVGGMVRFDGTRWIGFNNFQYGLGHPWPMPTDNSESVHVRANGHVAVNPTFNGIHEWTGSQFVQLQPSTVAMEITEDSLGRLW